MDYGCKLARAKLIQQRVGLLAFVIEIRVHTSLLPRAISMAEAAIGSFG